MTVPDTPSTESTDDEDDADQLAQPKKRTLREQEMRTTNLLLAQEHLDLIKNNGPKIQSEACLPLRFNICPSLTDVYVFDQTLMPEETAEAIVRVYLHDRTYKSVRVTVESTAEDVSKTLRLKLGSAWYVSNVQKLKIAANVKSSSGLLITRCTNFRKRMSAWWSPTLEFWR